MPNPDRTFVTPFPPQTCGGRSYGELRTARAQAGRVDADASMSRGTAMRAARRAAEAAEEGGGGGGGEEEELLLGCWAASELMRPPPLLLSAEGERAPSHHCRPLEAPPPRRSLWTRRGPRHGIVENTEALRHATFT